MYYNSVILFLLQISLAHTEENGCNNLFAVLLLISALSVSSILISHSSSENNALRPILLQSKLVSFGLHVMGTSTLILFTIC